MIHRSAFLIVIGWLTLTSSVLRDSDHWKELNPSIRDLLQDHIGPITRGYNSISDDLEFRRWYHRNLCLDRHEHGAKDCPMKGFRTPEEAYPEFAYNTLPLAERVASACLLWKISMSFGAHIPNELGEIISAGKEAFINMQVSSPGTLRTKLEENGYTPFFHANARKKIWGLRSPDIGPQLHWYQDQADEDSHRVSIHIDFYNPGAGSGSSIKGKVHDLFEAFEHTTHDYLHWNDRTMAEMVLAMGGSACGLGSSDLVAVMNETRGAFRIKFRDSYEQKLLPQILVHGGAQNDPENSRIASRRRREIARRLN